jgi:phosphatidylglycerol:prolipoprotein diacylglycerol transferase
MYPPDDKFLIYQLFGVFTVHWYAVCILGGSVLAAWFGARRGAAHGDNPDHAWNMLAIGLVTGIATARAWYVFFEWESFVQARSAYASTWSWLLLRVANPATGGIAIQGAILGAVLGGVVYARYERLDIFSWLDYAAPCFPIGQAIGRWGNFFNQEAYGRPMATAQPWGLRIDAPYRIHDFNAEQYPVDTTRFHPTFLYESLWSVLVLVTLLLMEQRLRGWLRKGDLFWCYGILYSVGRFFIEGLRTDSLCTSGLGGSCAGALRTAQVTALVTIALFGAILLLRHLRQPVGPRTA